MMGALKVNVSYLHIIAKEIGVKEEEVEVEGDVSLKELLSRLAERHGAAFKKYIYDNDEGKIKGYAIIIVNGKIIQRGKVEDVRLTEGDHVFFGIGAAGG
ncbi:MAG: MoaD/ThiS family protein [Candidatus Freyarchaeota archaeon]|nr:MoaD/ThiS family protein [Candidatus Jordarchaeia archaeon]